MVPGLIVKDPKIKGTIIITSSAGKTKEWHTHQCGHCGVHFMTVRGSGKTRGWCHNCKTVLCGSHPCFICMPFMEKLDLAEANQAKDVSTIKKILKKYPHIEKYQL